SVVAEEGQVRRAVRSYAELGAGPSLLVVKRQAQGAVVSHTQPRPGAVPANEPEARRAVWQHPRGPSPGGPDPRGGRAARGRDRKRGGRGPLECRRGPR